MTEKLTTAEAVRVLLDGGFIAERCSNVGKKRQYIVHKKRDLVFSRQITPKQFDELIGAGVICSIYKSRKDKCGNILNFYEIVWEREGQCV